MYVCTLLYFSYFENGERSNFNVNSNSKNSNCNNYVPVDSGNTYDCSTLSIAHGKKCSSPGATTDLGTLTGGVPSRECESKCEELNISGCCQVKYTTGEC
eukprot:Pgem_evm1s10970